MKLLISKPRYYWKTEAFEVKDPNRFVAMDYRIVEMQDKDTLTLAREETVVGVTV